MSIRNIKLNLLPPEFRPAPPVTGFSIFFGVMIGVTILFILVSLILTQGRANKLEDSLENKKRQLATMSDQLKEYDEKFAILQDTKHRKDMFSYLDNRFVDWPVFIANLVPLVPDKIWIVEINSTVDKEGGNKGTVTISGRTADEKILPIAFFMSKLEGSKYFQGVTFQESVLQLIKTKPIQEFSLTVKVQSEKPVKPKEEPKKPKDTKKGEGSTKGNNDSKENVAAAKPGAT